MNFITPQYKHQEEVFNEIKDKAYYALFWAMGTGKSKMAIDLIRYKMTKHRQYLKTLVVAPNIALSNWKNEFYKHSNLGGVTEILQGTKKQRLQKLQNPNKWVYIINFEGIQVIRDELLEFCDDKYYKDTLKIIVVDESQRIKNIKSIRTKILIKLGDKIPYKYILSGTPILNTPMDIFSQYRFLDSGKIFGVNFYSFRNKYFEDENEGFKAKKWYYPKWRPKPNIFELLNNSILQIADIKNKDECLDLPPKVYETLEIEMTKEQSKMYGEILKDMITFFQGKSPIVASNALSRDLRLNQITSGFIKTEENKEIFLDNNPKLKAIKELLEDLTVNHKIIIWAVFRKNIEFLFEELKQYNPAIIYGGINNKEEQQNKFRNDDSCRVIIANPQSAGLAINLIEADYAIYFSYNYSLEQRLQSEDRCHRSGSEIHSKITYIDLVCKNTIDDKILKAIKNKENIAKAVLNSII